MRDTVKIRVVERKQMILIKQSFLKGTCSALYLIGVLKVTISQQMSILNIALFIGLNFLSPSNYMFKDSKVNAEYKKKNLVDWDYVLEKLVFVSCLIIFRGVILVNF